MKLVLPQIMPGKSVPYWNIQGSYLVNLYLLTIYRLYTKFKIYKSNGNVREQPSFQGDYVISVCPAPQRLNIIICIFEAI